MVRLAAFVYDFPHQKSAIGLPMLSLAGTTDVLVLAAPFVGIGSTSVAPSIGVNPKEISVALGYRYETCGHDSEQAQQLLRQHDADFAVVLGARVLSAETLEAVGGPTLNLHPGILPENRGLDSAPWAIWNGFPQGVTAHIATPRIDGGPVLAMSLMSPAAIQDATDLSAIGDKLRWKEFELLEQVLLNYAQAGIQGIAPPSDGLGAYHTRMTPEQRSAAVSKLGSYKAAYPEIERTWLEAHSSWTQGIAIHPW